MGWLSSLAKLGLMGAAPFTGGASLAGLPLVEGLSGVVGGIAEGRAKGKVSEADANATFDRNRLNARGITQNAEMDKGRLLNERAALDLQQRKYGDDSRGQYTRQALMGALMGGGGAMASRPAGVPNISFGMNPSALFGQTGQDAGAEMKRQALLDLMGGRPEFQKLPDPNVLPEMQMTPLPKSNLFDKILGVAGPVLGGLGALGRAAQGGTPAMTSNPASSVSQIRKGLN